MFIAIGHESGDDENAGQARALLEQVRPPRKPDT